MVGGAAGVAQAAVSLMNPQRAGSPSQYGATGDPA